MPGGDFFKRGHLVRQLELFEVDGRKRISLWKTVWRGIGYSANGETRLGVRPTMGEGHELSSGCSVLEVDVEEVGVGCRGAT